MQREAGTFSCPEHAIAVAYLMLAYPIEPKNPTQIICEALQERFDTTYERKALSGLTPHDWHAQAVFIVKALERGLGDSVGFHILRAQYGTGEEGARSARAVSRWLNPDPGFVDVFLVKVLQPGTAASGVDGRGAPAKGTDPLGWALTASGIEAQGAKLGIQQLPGEQFPDFKTRVHAAAGLTEADRGRLLADYGVRV